MTSHLDGEKSISDHSGEDFRFGTGTHPLEAVAQIEEDNNEGVLPVLDVTFQSIAGDGGGNEEAQRLLLMGGEEDDDDDDDGIDGLAAREESLISATRRRGEGPHELWWMDFIKKEGLLDQDPSPLQAGEVNKKHQLKGALSTSPDEVRDEAFLAGGGEEESDVKQTGDNSDQILTDDLSAGEEEHGSEDESDWRERLWVIARNHWNDLRAQETTPEETEMAMLSARDDEEDRRQIDTFRDVLLTCLEAYVQVFGEISTPPSDDGKQEKVDEDVDGGSSLAKEAAKMSAYVPFRVARRLFHLVLLEVQSKAEFEAQLRNEREDEKDQLEDEKKNVVESLEAILVRKRRDPTFIHYSGHITEVLLSPYLNIFRTYVVEPTESHHVEEQNGEGGPHGLNIGRRVRTNRNAEDRRKLIDVEKLLYGDMDTQEKKEEVHNEVAPENRADDLPDIDDDDDEATDHEEEVRLRTAVVSQIMQEFQKKETKIDWRLPFLREVLLKGLLKDSLSTDDHIAISQLLGSRLDKRTETSLSYMYSIRYFPHFYLRASWNTESEDSLDNAAFAFLMKYFSDARLIRNRLVVLGVYNGVMVHIEELNSLFRELQHRLQRSNDCDEMYREVHRSVSECLSSILTENLRSINFVPTHKSEQGSEWRQPSSDGDTTLKSSHPRVVSICLEVGRSFHYQGVTLGKREQSQLMSRLEADPDSFEVSLPKFNFDDDMTELEVSAYVSAQSAFEDALKVLNAAEGLMRTNHKPKPLPPETHAPNNDPSKELQERQLDMEEERKFQTAIKHILEARATVQLYMSDSFTTLGYCYEAKLSDFQAASSCYSQSLRLYSQHVGRDHPTVLHTLQSLGSVHMELKQWKDAESCFNECMNQMRPGEEDPEISGRDKEKRQTAVSVDEQRSIVKVMQALGAVKMQNGEYDTAAEILSNAIDTMSFAVGNLDSMKIDKRSKEKDERLICDLMSNLVDVLFMKLSQIKTTYSKRRLELIYSDEDRFEIGAFDTLRLARLQVERRAMEVSRDAVNLRSRLLDIPDLSKLEDESVLSNIRNRKSGNKMKLPKWFQVLSYVKDMLKLGKLLFRQCDHADAIKVWREAMTLLQQGSDPDGGLYEEWNGQMFSRVMQDAAGEVYLDRIQMMSELTYLTGVARCRLGDNEEAAGYYERGLMFLEYKRKAMCERPRNVPSEQDWEILDLDVGHCEHALGLAHFYANRFTPATSHYREALRLFEAVAARRKARQQSRPGQRGRMDFDELENPEREEKPSIVDGSPGVEERSGEIDIAINGAIASVMLSLGALYHEQSKNDRSQRFLGGSIQIIQSTAHKLLTIDRDPERFRSTTGFNVLSLVRSIIRVGDAHRRIALMNLDRNQKEAARVPLGTAIRYLESANLEARLTTKTDDELDLETISQNEICDMLLSCYENMMILVDNSPKPNHSTSTRSSSWFGFGRQAPAVEIDSANEGLTREDLLFRLGNVHAKRSNFESAIRCFLDARNLTEDRLGTSNHKIIGNIMFNLGNVFKSIYLSDRDRPDVAARDRAVESFEESLQIARITTGPDSMAVAEVMESLAALLMGHEIEQTPDTDMLDEEEAQNLYREAVSIRKMHRNDMDLSFAQSMHFLGLLALRRCVNEESTSKKGQDDKNLDEAMRCLSQALHVRKLLLGDHLFVAQSAHYLGVAMRTKAMSGGAYADQILADAKKNLTLSLFLRNSFLERSIRLAKKPNNANSLALKHDLDGTSDVYTVVVRATDNLHEIAIIHEQERNFEYEKSCLHDALDLLEYWTSDGDHHDSWTPGDYRSQMLEVQASAWKSKIYHRLGVCWSEEEDTSQAVADFEKSLVFRGIDTLETETPDELFDNFFKQGRNPGDERQSGDLEGAITMEMLAVAYDKLGKVDSALRCYTFALRVFGVQLGDESMKVAGVLKKIGSVYQSGHDYKRCVRALQRALHIRDLYESNDALPKIEDALVFVQLARALMALGAYDQVALDHFYEAVDMLETINAHLSKANPLRVSSITGTNLSIDNQEEEQRQANELLLECHSSILVLIRRGGTDIPNSEERVCGVLHRIGNTQAALGKYDKALKSLQHVISFHQSMNGNNKNLSIADLLFNLGNIYVEVGEIEKARECHQECHGITLEVLGEESVELSENMICLGNVEFLSRNYAVALEWFDEALRLLRHRKDFDASVCKVLQRKASSFDKLGEYPQSIDCFGEALKIGRRLWGADHVEISNVLNALGNVHRNQGELRRALRCYEESLRIRTKGNDRMGVSNTKNNIGAIFVSMGKVEQARRFYADSLWVKTETLGGNHIETARTLYNMGQLYIDSRETNTALAFLHESLRIFKANLGANHNEVAACLCSVGTVYDEADDEELALNYFKKALNAVKGQSQSSAVRAQALHNVGIILTKRNEVDHAVRIFREALQIKAELADATEDTQYCLANVLRLTGCVAEALEFHKSALDTRIRQLGPENESVADSLFGLGQTLVDSNRHNDALGVLRQCCRIRIALFGDTHNLVADVLFLLGIVLREVGSLSEAFSCLKQAIEVKSSAVGKDTVEVADIAFKLAIVLVELGKYEEAKTYSQRCLQIRIQLLGTLHPDIATTMENMGVIEQKLGNHEVAIDWMKKALEIKRLSVGDQHEDISAIVHTMAQSLAELDNLENAIQLFQDAVRRKKQTFGQKHIEVARVLVDQGHLFERVDQADRALMCYEEAVDTDCFEDNSWEIGRVFMRMGITHFSMEKTEDAWDCLSEATRVFELIERREKRRKEKEIAPTDCPGRDLRDLIRCYECMLRLSEANPNRYNVDRSLVLPKVANVLADIKYFRKAAALYKDAIIIQKSLPGDTRFIVATNLHNLGNCLHHLGEINEAMICLEDALGLFQEIPGVEEKHIADTHHSLGVVHQSKTNLQEALSSFSNALKSRRRSPEPKLEALATLTNIGEVLRMLGLHDAAIASCKNALRMLDTKQDSTILNVAQIIECIGRTHFDQYEYEKALRCFAECVKQRREAPGTHEYAVAKTLYQIGSVHLVRGDKEEAANSFEESLDIIQGTLGIKKFDCIDSSTAKARMRTLTEALKDFVEAQIGMNPVEGAETLVTTGSLLENCDRLDEAIVCNEIAIKFITEALGPDHLLLAEVKHRMGFIRFKLGDYERALPKLREALQVRRAKLGDNHSHTEDTIKMLARANAAIGDSEMALFYFKELMSKDRSVSKDMDGEADLLLRLGKLHLEQAEFADALVCFRDSLKVQRQGGPDRDENKLGDTLQCMGSALLDMKQLQEARITLLSALKVLESTGDEDSEELLSTIFLLGRVNEEEDSIEKALAWYERGLKIIESLEDPDTFMRARVTFRLGIVKFCSGESEEAIHLLLDAKDLFASSVGEDHVEYATCLHSIGRLHFDGKELQEAKDAFQAALKIRHEHLNKNDAKLGESLHWLGSCLMELKQMEAAKACLQQALKIRLSVGGGSDEDVGITCRCLGFVEHHLGEASAAMEHFQDAIRIGMALLLKSKDIVDTDEFNSIARCLETAIAIAKENEESPEKLGKLYHQQGSLQSTNQLYRKAMTSFTEAIQCYKMVYGEEHLSVANALFNVGVCLKEVGDGDRAMKCFTRALSITRHQLGEDHPDVADTKQQMAQVYNMKGDVGGALKLCEQCLSIRRYTEDLALAALLDFTGELCCACRDGEEAEKCYRESLRIRRNLIGDSSLVAESVFRLGFVYESFRRDFKRALRCYEEALRVRIVVHEDSSIEMARGYLHLGNVQSAVKNYKKAAFCFKQATAICERSNDPLHDIVQDAIVGQGQVLASQGKHEQALEQYKKARSVRDQQEGRESLDIANILLHESDSLLGLGRTDDARQLLLSTLDMFKLSVGIEHIGTANCLQKLAEVHLDFGGGEDALSYAQQALKIRKNLLRKSDEAVGESYFVIARVFFHRGDFDTAKPCLEAALEVFRQQPGPAELNVSDAMFFLGCVHEAKKNWQDSIKCFHGVLQVRQKKLGLDDPLVAKVLYRLGCSHTHLEQFEMGADCFNECLRIRTLLHGPDSLDVADVLYKLGSTLKEAEEGNTHSKMDASQRLAEAIRIYRTILGENEIPVAKCLAKLGGILEAKGEENKAGGCYERAVVIFERDLREDPSREEIEQREEDYDAYASALLDYAKFLDAVGRDGSAMKTYRRALKLCQILKGRDHEIIGTTLCSIANVLGRQERFTEAMQLYGEVLKRRVSSLGDNHPMVADVYYGMALIFEKKRDYQAAMSSLEKCIRIRRATVGPWTEEVAEALISIGMVQKSKDDLPAALQSWDEALAVYRKAGLQEKDTAVVNLLKHQAAVRATLRRIDE